MRDWKREVREAIAAAKLDADAAREEAVVEELAQDLAERHEALTRNGTGEEDAARMLCEELRDARFLQGLRPRLGKQLPSTPGMDRPTRFLAGVGRDVRVGARVLRANPVFTLVAILSLTLGIGANTAIFELLDAVLLRTLSVAAPEQLAEVRVNHPGRIGSSVARQQDFSNPQWREVEREQQGFSKIAAWSTEGLNLARGGEARYAKGLWVSGDFFPLLQTKPELGRLLTKSDDYKGCGIQGAVISDGFWHRQFGGRVDVIGKTLSLNGEPFSIIGVTPANFSGLEPGFTFDVALPLCSEVTVQADQPWTEQATTWWLAVIGRLKPGWSSERAAAQLNAIAPGVFAATLPAEYDAAAREKYLKFTFRVLPAATGVSSSGEGLKAEYRVPLFVLLGISGLVLLIACANLANLMLARASAREREMALRVTLGASRVRLMQQVLVESMLLAATGAVAGAMLAQVLTRLLIGFISSEDNPLFLPLRADWPVLLFTTAVTVLTCLLFGAAPALQAARSDPGAAMKGGRGSTSGRQSLALRRTLVVVQVGLSLVLLMVALLFVRTFRNLLAVNAGLRQDGVLVADFDFSPLKIPPARRPEYKRQLLATVRSVPGVDAAAEVINVPMTGNSWNRFVDIPEKGVQRRLVDFNAVSGGFFKTLEVPLLAGRDFDERDTVDSPRVAIVNERFAQEMLGGSNPVGVAFHVTRGKPEEKVYQIVGLVGNTKYRDLREDFQPIIFLAESQDAAPDPDSTFVVRSEESSASLIGALKEVAERTSPETVLNFSVLRTSVLRGMTRERLMATLSGFYGGLAATLAMIGLYGVVSFMVIRRRNEIGIRMAMGAGRTRILRMILLESAVLIGEGLAVGVILVLAAANATRAMLFGIRANDPTTLAMAMGGLALAAVGASLIPAVRATGVQPVEILREE